MSNSLIGIDAGTGRMKIAKIDVSGRAVPIEFPDGDNTMPSCVYFENGTMPVFGAEAFNQGLIDSKSLVMHWKRSMGTTEVLFTAADGTQYMAKDVLALLLQECKRVTEVNMGTVVSRVVISVPANYTDAAKNDTLEAAERAGLEVIKLAHEPSAALFNKTA